MPMVIPIVAAFAAGAAGVAALSVAGGLVATVAAYATIAGAVLTGVGAITGSKSLMKIGAILSIGGGIASIGAGLAESAASSATMSGMDVAADAASTATAGGTAAGIDAGVEAGMAPQTAGLVETPAPTSTLTALETGATPAAVAPTTGMPTTLESGSSLERLSANTPNTVANVTAPDPGAITPSSIDPSTPSFSDARYDASRGMSQPTTANPAVADTPALRRLQEQASKTNSSDMSSWFEKMRNIGGSVGEFMQKNPQLVKIGGDMLSSMYGPQAERFDYEKSLMERARSNLNSPVAMRYVRPGG